LQHFGKAVAKKNAPGLQPYKNGVVGIGVIFEYLVRQALQYQFNLPAGYDGLHVKKYYKTAQKLIGLKIQYSFTPFPGRSKP
jgi:hypothetical protein